MKKFIGDIRVTGAIEIPASNTERALTVNALGEIESSNVTTTELSRLSGVTSSIQDQLDAKIDATEKGAADGVATLDGTGKIPVAQLPASVMEFKGAWDASTNTPTLADGVGDTGDIYRVSVAGTQDLGSGNITFAVGDLVMYNGTIWQRSPASDAPVLSVNGETGVVVLDTDDIAEGSTNLYFADERAQDAVGTILADSSSINLTYNDATPEITAEVIPGGVDHDQLLNYVANDHVDHSSVQIATGANSGLAGGGDITTTRNLSVNIDNATAETSADNADLILIHDDSAGALRKMTRGNFLSGIPQASPGDINEASFAGANNQSSPADITGLAFGAGVRSFTAYVAVELDATVDLYEQFVLEGIYNGAGWEMAVSAVGGDTGVAFTIDASGQVEYTSANSAGFVSLTFKFRAITLSI